LRFHKRSTDGSVKCDIPESSSDSDIVWGVVFEMPENKIGALDRAETGYIRTAIEVLREDAPLISAASYITNPANIDSQLLPYTWYRDLVVVGARQHNLSVAYISQLIAVVAVPDLDRERCALALKSIDEYYERQSNTPNKPSI
jgi:gamma-glutamylcyclotransferase